MGASEWVYYVPYQEDIEQAFQTLRQQVFETKSYHNWAEVLEYEQIKEALCVEHDVDIQDEEAVEKLLQAEGPIEISDARTIEELLEKPDDGQGTHSILDITQFYPSWQEPVSADSSNGMRTILPFSRKNLIRFWGTEQPTKERAEDVFAQRDVWSIIHRWMGYYAVIYQNEFPYEIAFVGCSGD